jgi:hypothetical protein
MEMRGLSAGASSVPDIGIQAIAGKIAMQTIDGVAEVYFLS